MANLTINALQVRPLVPSETKTVITAEAVTIGQVVRFTNSGIQKANATDAAGNAGLLGIVVSGGKATTAGVIASGGTATVVVKGFVFLGKSQGLTDKGTIFTSTTAGRIADATSTYARPIGHVVDSETIYFDADAL